MQKSFAALGISIEDLKSLSPDEIMLKIGHSSLNAADTVKVLGKSALELRPTLAGLADGTIKFGGAIDGVDIKRLKEADDAFKTLAQQVTIVAGGALASFFVDMRSATALWAIDLKQASVQLEALHTAAKTTNPTDFIAALRQGRDEGAKLDREKVRVDDEIRHPEKYPSNDKEKRNFGKVSDDAEKSEAGKTTDEGLSLGGGKKTSDEREADKYTRDLARDKAELAEVEKQHHLDSLSAQQRLAELKKSAQGELDTANDAVRSELERVDAKLRYHSIAKEIERTEKEIARETKTATKDDHGKDRQGPKSLAELTKDAQDRDTADRRAHGSYTGSGADHPGLVSGGKGPADLEAEERLSHRSQTDFKSDFGKHVDLGPKHLDLNRQEQLKTAMNNSAGKNSELAAALDKSSVAKSLQAIEKNTNGIGKNK